MSILPIQPFPRRISPPSTSLDRFENRQGDLFVTVGGIPHGRFHIDCPDGFGCQNLSLSKLLRRLRDVTLTRTRRQSVRASLVVRRGFHLR